jgi:hypothetical protein
VVSRGLILVVVLFWGTMNVLLWRAEFGRGRDALSEVPLGTVVDRLLNAPDPSALQISQRGTVLGSLRWIPTVLESRTSGGEDPSVPEGLVDATGYSLDLDLNLRTVTDGPLGRLRIMTHVDLDTNHVWQSISVRIYQRPAIWEISAKAGGDSVRIRHEEGGNTVEQDYTARDLRALLGLMGGAAALVPMPVLSEVEKLGGAGSVPRVRWNARNDWLRIGRSRVRTYRVEMTFLDTYTVVAQLSRAGEILEVRLPEGIALANESVPLSRGP